MLRIIALGTLCVFFFAFPFAGTLPEVGAVASLVEGFGRSLKFVPLADKIGVAIAAQAGVGRR